VIPLTCRIGLPARPTYHHVVRPPKAFAVAVLAFTATPLAVAQFSKDVPLAIPSVEGWERITGDLEFARRRVTVQYEFYVNPARPAIYEVVRYRVTDLGPVPKDKVRYPTTEKLQWDRDGRDLRRFECVETPPAGVGCTWQEMEKGGSDYLREVPVLLWLYGAHNARNEAMRRGATS
jgi:hypothetical protein